MMLFCCCFDTLQTRSPHAHDAMKTYGEFYTVVIYTDRHCRWLCQHTNDTGRDDLKREWKRKKSTYSSQLGKCYKRIQHIYKCKESILSILSVYACCTYLCCVIFVRKYNFRFYSETWLSFYWPIFPQTNY